MQTDVRERLPYGKHNRREGETLVSTVSLVLMRRFAGKGNRSSCQSSHWCQFQRRGGNPSKTQTWHQKRGGKSHSECLGDQGHGLCGLNPCRLGSIQPFHGNIVLLVRNWMQFCQIWFNDRGIRRGKFRCEMGSTCSQCAGIHLGVWTCHTITNWVGDFPTNIFNQPPYSWVGENWVHTHVFNGILEVLCSALQGRSPVFKSDTSVYMVFPTIYSWSGKW